jgi:hypothetical protein
MIATPVAMPEAKRAEEKNDPRVRREPEATNEPRAWKVAIPARISHYAASQATGSAARPDWKATGVAARHDREAGGTACGLEG